MFDNYWYGGGDISLSNEEFQMIASAAQFSPVLATQLIGGGLLAKKFDFYQTSRYDSSIGKGWLIFNGAGKAVGFNDNYNFDWQWNRTSMSELKTRLVSAAGFFLAQRLLRSAMEPTTICQRVNDNEILAFSSCSRTVYSLLPAVLLS